MTRTRREVLVGLPPPTHDHPLRFGGSSNCLVFNKNVSYGAGGLWPHAQGASGPRNDGLRYRIRDAAHPNGLAVVFLGQGLGCDSLPLPGIANGALYLNPVGVFVQVTCVLDAGGFGSGPLVTPSPVVRAAVNRTIDFQALTLSSALTLPGNLTSRTAVTNR